jgi:hypothetical protein
MRPRPYQLSVAYRAGNGKCAAAKPTLRMSLTALIPSSSLRSHFVRATVRLREYPDGRLAIFHGPHRMADYDSEGNPCDDTKLAA